MNKCKYCKSTTCVKAGLQKNQTQRYLCKSCKRYQQAEYKYESYAINDKQIRLYVCEGVGIRSMGRMLSISKNTVIKRIRALASGIVAPTVYQSKQVYEMDEMYTFIQNKTKECWIAYCINRKTGCVIDFRIGGRTLKVLKPVVESMLYRQPKRIYTDKLSHYENLIPKKLHRISQYGTNKIERLNLTLRTHIKRLNRRSICFSKKRDMLEACLKIYFWG